MRDELKPLSCKPLALIGLSEKCVVSRMKNKYGDAKKRLNVIEQNWPD